MKRVFVLALGLLFAPALISAQVEVGVDGGLAITSYDSPSGFDIDSQMDISLPMSTVRVGFAAGEQLLVDSFLGFTRTSQGDNSYSSLVLMPGVNFLLGEQFYVRGEAGLMRMSSDNGTTSNSATQYAFGGAAGLRMPLGDAALFRVEGGVDKWLENQDDGLLGSWQIRGLVGISAIVN